MKIGFTGTQEGMTAIQAIVLLETIKRLALQEQITNVTHGDCIGSDYEFDYIIHKYFASAVIEIYPSNIDHKRAYCLGNIIHPPMAPLVRNRFIVEGKDVLLATPKEMEEVLRSGTWATIRYGFNLKLRVIIIFPDGTVSDSSAEPF